MERRITLVWYAAIDDVGVAEETLGAVANVATNR
jgi:hypothetical protein